ncbi:hypothetical protein AAT19DRAFT_8756 [Rhodotorula toruloides]|uniref:Uncharacterized protein n=1 Tax=Rhodotorula toruloides TaxID=5286 RepID=A0A2T0AI58_RHOTO|nr:hypothetical protein AAT19DRAFT_8756 [Rhodotorula toruloides]
MAGRRDVDAHESSNLRVGTGLRACSSKVSEPAGERRVQVLLKLELRLSSASPGSSCLMPHASCLHASHLARPRQTLRNPASSSPTTSSLRSRGAATSESHPSPSHTRPMQSAWTSLAASPASCPREGDQRIEELRVRTDVTPPLSSRPVRRPCAVLARAVVG